MVPLPAPIYMSTIAASVPPSPTQANNQIPIVTPSQPVAASPEKRYGVKIKIAVFIVVAFWLLSSHTFHSALNTLVCSFSSTASPCSNEYGCGTMKGYAISGCILFLFIMYLLGEL